MNKIEEQKQKEAQDKRNKNFLISLVRTSEKIAEKKQMKPEQKREYMNKKLFDYFERNEFDKITDEMTSTFKEIYPEFSKEDFTKYVVLHTKNTNVIFDEKLKLEDKVKDVKSRIYEINKELARGMYIQPKDRKKLLIGKIEEVEKKYSLQADEEIKLTDEQIEENIELIDEIINQNEDCEKLHTILKEKASFFTGMGSKYQEVVNEKSPKYYEYIKNKKEKELNPLLGTKQKLEKEREQLEEIQSGLQECIEKVYDPRLERERRGNEEERQHFKFITRAEKSVKQSKEGKNKNGGR